MPTERRNYPPGSQLNNFTLLEEVFPEDTKYRRRFFLVRCQCGFEGVRRLDTIQKSQSCIECSKKYDYLYKQYPEIPRNIQASHAWEMWNNLLSRERDRGVLVCHEWHDFANFLPWYLEVTGLQLSDVLRGRNGALSFFRADRIDKEQPWSPENFSVTKFVTERANHKTTYAYWYKLKGQGILAEDLMSYKAFVAAFGTKLPYWFLTRRDITKPHSTSNSFWKQKNVRRSDRGREE